LIIVEKPGFEAREPGFSVVLTFAKSQTFISLSVAGFSSVKTQMSTRPKLTDGAGVSSELFAATCAVRCVSLLFVVLA
jgi:hypothetical protein